MESMIGLSVCFGVLFMLFQFRGVAKKEAKSMEAESSANYAKRYTRAVIKANEAYNRIKGKGYYTLEDIESRLEGTFNDIGNGK